VDRILPYQYRHDYSKFRKKTPKMFDDKHQASWRRWWEIISQDDGMGMDGIVLPPSLPPTFISKKNLNKSNVMYLQYTFGWRHHLVSCWFTQYAPDAAVYFLHAKASRCRFFFLFQKKKGLCGHGHDLVSLLVYTRFWIDPRLIYRQGLVMADHYCSTPVPLEDFAVGFFHLLGTKSHGCQLALTLCCTWCAHKVAWLPASPYPLLHVVCTSRMVAS
jgi:hypothetical protein